MHKLTTEEYYRQQTECDSLCDITEKVAEEKNYLRCVTCPFCKELVDAILTKTNIACPACGIIVDR